MPKVMTIVGTRPELIKMSEVIRELDECCDHVFVHSGQNFDYELNEVFYRDLGIRKPDHFLDVAGSGPIQTISNTLLKVDSLLESERPDALMLYGDTNTGLAIIPAKRRRVPVIHMEAGNRCFDERVPEEINRRIIDHLADINIVLTEHARRYLLAEGIRPDTIFKSGSHLPEILDRLSPAVAASTVLSQLGLERDRFLLVSLHREENVDDSSRLIGLTTALSELSRVFDMPVIVSPHPRTRKRLDAVGGQSADKLGTAVRYLKPFGYVDYLALQKAAYCVLSDSGTITEECALLGFPAVNVRDAHERPEGVDAGTLIMSGLGLGDMERAIRVTRRHFELRTAGEGRVADYEARGVARKIVKLVLGYIGYVNRIVWRDYSSNSAQTV